MVDKVALRQVFFEYFGYPCQFPFQELFHNHHVLSGVGTVGQTVAAVPSGLSITPMRKIKNNNKKRKCHRMKTGIDAAMEIV
jgi:hypothetical protein